MAWTAQNAFDRAVQRSSLNDATLVPTAEALSYISTYQRKAFLLAARLNPAYFGKDGTTNTRTAHTASWDLDVSPGDVAALTYAEVAAITGAVTGVVVGDRVNLVDFRWPDLEVSPRAYVRGRKISQRGTELGTNASNLVTQLKVFYSELPSPVTSMTLSLRLPEEWQDLIVVPLAALLALRDKREEEIEILRQELLDVTQMFSEAVLVYDHAVHRPLISVPAIPIPVPRQ